VKATLDKLVPSLNEYERQYMMKKILQRIRKNPPASFVETSCVSEPLVEERSVSNIKVRVSNPHLRGVIEDLAKVEKYVTMGYPPVFVVPQSQENNGKDELKELALRFIVDRLGQFLENPKLGDKVADLIGGLADMLEGKTT
jgi:hypothetical protein